ncbi:MAG: TonB-dependent receptor [Alphaproteobacteria bacterium]|nr:TonB-dependent receptor [Alphaproteobacteria bacterium]
MLRSDLSCRARNILRISASLFSAFLLLSVFAGHSGRAEPNPAEYQFNIPAMPLSEALVQFSQVSKTAILAPGAIAKGKRSTAIDGALPLEKALQQLIAGTGLAFQIKSRNIIVLSVAPRASLSPSTDNARAAEGQIEAPAPISDKTNIDEILVTEDREITDRSEISPAAKSLLDIAGTLDDPMWGMMANPAITFGSQAYGGELIIRGSSPDDHLILLDGMPLGFLFHRFGDSILSRDTIHRLDLKPSAFSAQYGGAIGSIVDIGLRQPNTSHGAQGTIAISKMRAGIHLEAPVGQNAGFYVNGRINTLHLFHPTLGSNSDQAPQAEETPRNFDYTARYHHTFGNTAITATVVGAHDKQALHANAGSDPFLNEQTETEFHTQALAFEKSWNNHATLNVIFSQSNKHERRTLGAVGFEKAKTSGVYLRSKLTVHNNGHKLILGSNFSNEQGNYDYNTRLLFCDDFTGQCPSSDTERRTRTNTLRDLEIFGIDQMPLGENTHAEVGVQISRDFFLKETFLEPRLGLFWQALPKLQLYARYGRHHQRQDIRKYLELRYTAAEQANDTADHFLLGGHMTFAKSWSITSEAYYRHQDTALYLASSQERYVGGNIYGLELSIVKAASELGLSGSVSIGYSKSIRRDKSTGQSVRYRYNRPLNVTAELGWKLPNGWRMGAKYQHQSGLPYTPVEGVTVAQGGYTTYRYAPLFSARTGNHNRLDFHIEKRTDHAVGTIIYHLDILNAFGQNSPSPPLYYGVFPDKHGEPQPQTYINYGLPRIVSIGLTISF